MKGMYELGREVDGLTERLEVIEDARAKSSTLNITGLVNRVRDIERAMLEADTSLRSRIETLEAGDVCIGIRVSDLEAAAPKPDAKPADCPWCGSRCCLSFGGSATHWVCCEGVDCKATGPALATDAAAIAAWNKVAKRD